MQQTTTSGGLVRCVPLMSADDRSRSAGTARRRPRRRRAALGRPPLAAALALALAFPLAGCGGGGDDGKAPTAHHGSPGASGPSGKKAPVTKAPDAWVPGYVAKMSLREKVGQLFVPTFSSRASALAIVRKYHVGGFIYFPENFGSPAGTAEQSNALQKASKVPLLLGVDEEQGIVSRTPFITRFPGNMALGATRSTADAR